MGTFLDLITDNWVSIVNLVTQIVGGFAILATWTPNTVDNRIAQILMDGVNFLGANVNKAANR